MNIIVRNLYVKEFCFGSFREQTLFLDNINSSQKIGLENTYGELYYCYVLSLDSWCTILINKNRRKRTG